MRLSVRTSAVEPSVHELPKRRSCPNYDGRHLAAPESLCLGVPGLCQGIDKHSSSSVAVLPIPTSSTRQ
jgi:hypothetical protein